MPYNGVKVYGMDCLTNAQVKAYEYYTRYFKHLMRNV